MVFTALLMYLQHNKYSTNCLLNSDFFIMHLTLCWFTLGLLWQA